MRGGSRNWTGRQKGVYNADITGFMAGFNLVNTTLADVGREGPLWSHIRGARISG